MQNDIEKELELTPEEAKKLYHRIQVVLHRKSKDSYMRGYHRACVDHGLALSDVPIEDLDASYRHDILAKFVDK